MADLPDLATNRLPEFGALLGLPQIMLGGKAGPQAVDQRACRTDHLQQPVPALLLQKVVRVLAFRQHGQPRRLARLQQRQQPFKRAFLGALPGGIAVETEHRLVMQFPKMSNLLFGQRGAERRHSGGHAALLDGDHIHIAFGNEKRQLAPQPFAGLHPAIENRFLGKGRPLARIQVFGLRVAERPRAKGDDTPLLVLDRKHDPVAEIVEQLAVPITAPDDTCRQHVLVCETARSQRRAQSAARGIAEAIAADRTRIQAAPMQVTRRDTAVIPLQAGLKIPGCFLEDIEGCLSLTRALRVLGRAARHGESGHGRQPLDSFHEIQAVGLAKKGNGVAMHAAAKAMVEALVIDNRKRGSLFRMERAQAGEAVALPGQLDALSDDVRKRHPLAQILDEFRWDGHSLPVRLLL